MDKKGLKVGADYVHVLQGGWRCTKCAYSVAKNRLDNLKSESTMLL